MSCALPGSADEDDSCGGHSLINDGTASKYRNKCLSQDTANYYRKNITSLKNNSDSSGSDNKKRNTDYRKFKEQKILVCKEYKCKYDTTQKCTGTCRPRSYRVISHSAPDVIGKSILKNECLKPKYVVTKRDPKLRPLEEVAPRKAKHREQVIIRNDQQASCSMRISQKQAMVEKMTYCRPHTVNEDSVAKAVERNNRLQNIVQKLIEVRQIEKEREAWNNFINELKTKHELNIVHTNENELINDCGNVRFYVPPAISKPVRYYIEDINPYSSSALDQEIKPYIYDYQSVLDNSYLSQEAQSYLCYPNICVRKKTPEPLYHTSDFTNCSYANRQDEDFYAPQPNTNKKYRRKTEYVPLYPNEVNEGSMPSQVTDNDYPLTDNKKNSNRGGKSSKYKQHTDRVARRRTTCNNELVQNLVTSSTHRTRNQAVKISTEREKSPSSFSNKTKSNVPHSTSKQKQVENEYKKIFKDFATNKEQIQDDKSHSILENIENKLDILIKGISELLQEIKPKCNQSLLNEKRDINVPRQYCEKNICCRNCDSVFKSAVVKKILEQEVPKETIPKREITTKLCKNLQCGIKHSISQLEDDISDAEYDKYSMHDNALIDKYDRYGLDGELTTAAKDHSSALYYLKSIEQEIDDNKNQLELRNEDNDRYTDVVQDVDREKRIIHDGTRNKLRSGHKNTQVVDDKYGSRKNKNNTQNEESGMWNKSPKTEGLSQISNRRCSKFKTEFNENYDKVGVSRMQSDATEKPMFLRTTLVTPKSGTKIELEHLKTQNVLSTCRRSTSRERKLDNYHTSEENKSSTGSRLYSKKEKECDCFRDMMKDIRRQDPDEREKNSNYKKISRFIGQIPESNICRRQMCKQQKQDILHSCTSDENQPSSESKCPSKTETECDCFIDVLKSIRREELENQRQNLNDKKLTRFNRKISESDSHRQSISLQKKIQKPKPFTTTSISARSGPNKETRYDVQDFITQTLKYETKTCQSSEVRVVVPDVTIINGTDEKNNEKNGYADVSDTKFDPKIEKTFDTEQNSDLETRKLCIDNSTSVKTAMNDCIGSYSHKGIENIYGFKNKDQYTCAVVESYGLRFCNSHSYKDTKIDKIIIEEMNNNDQINKDIENILNGEFNKACAVSFSFDMPPTRERATEISSSLFAVVPYERNELYSSNSANRTINTVAINTDPMGFLTLLRISTNAIRSFLGQVNLDRLYSPLGYITQSTLMQKGIPDFICNMCGSVFPSRSQLSLHKINHRSDFHRDCCVCRNLLEMRKRRVTRLFTCKYCGQCFTRAYCCELHQHVCAHKKGLQHDGVQRLSILR